MPCRAVPCCAPQPMAPVAQPPAEPRVEELRASPTRHAQWHGMERALSAADRALERLVAEQAWSRQERLATRNALYARTTPRRVYGTPVMAPARRPGTRAGISSTATSAGGFKEKMRAREEERRQHAVDIHAKVDFTRETQAALNDRLCPKPRSPARKASADRVVAWAASKDCRVTTVRASTHTLTQSLAHSVFRSRAGSTVSGVAHHRRQARRPQTARPKR